MFHIFVLSAFAVFLIIVSELNILYWVNLYDTPSLILVICLSVNIDLIIGLIVCTIGLML